MNRKNKLLVLLTVLLLVFGVAACGDKTPDVPTTDGKEIGSYYYDTGAEDYIVSLMDGMKASFTAKGATQNGTYTLVDGTLTLKLEGSTISASYGNDTVSMIYEGRALTFIRMVNYKVSFKTADGEEIAEKDVIGGKKVEAPEAPEKENAVFIGWYADSDCTVPFNFSEAITAETTVYARYAAVVEGQVEYDVTLMVDGNKLATKTTIGGVVYNLPTPTAAGKTFAGWWMSAYQDAEKLTCKYEEQKIGEDSVLYAVWAEDLNVSVYADGIVISAPGANNTYDIVISDAEGNVLHSEKTGYANVAYDFAAQGTGAYTVAVTLKGETFTAYYCQNALNRVTEIEVEGNVISFEPVANGRGYYVTVDCGNDAHQHTFVPLGNATEYDFSACDMQEGGIVFTIFAEAEGYITSTSAPFVVERNLPAVEGLAYALDNESISWNAVEGAESYVITVTKGNETATYTVNGSVTTYSLKGYNGRVTVNVTAMAKGFNPSEAEIIFVNDRLLAPETIWLEGKALAWTQVEGAVSYNIKIGDKVFTSATNSLTLTDEHYTDGVSAYVISVQAVAAVADKNSLYSASYTFRSGSMADTLVYENGAVTWEYVLDASKYGVKVNDGEETIVSAANNSAKVAFAQAGVNTVSVRCYDENGDPSAWVNVSVTAYEITFNTQGGDEMASIFVANGDEVDLTEAYYEGYVFNGWYTVAEGGEQIEKPWDTFVFEAGKSVELYAYWNPAPYIVTLVVGGKGEEFVQKEYTVYYQQEFKLPVAAALDPAIVFGGWYTDPNAQGFQYTDPEGDSVAVWTDTFNRTLYASWLEVLQYNLINNGTEYSVEQGPGIDYVKKVVVPAEYAGKKVTTVDPAAFKSCSSIVEVWLPDTIKSVFIGPNGGYGTDSAFQTCTKLSAIQVYCPNPEDHFHHEVFYEAVDGALIYHNPNTGLTEFAYLPYTRKGSFKIPDGVESLPIRSFYNVFIEEIIIPASVVNIDEDAFYLSDIAKITFLEPAEGEAVMPLVIGAKAFRSCTALKSVTLPSRLDSFATDAFQSCSELETIDVMPGGAFYSKDGFLCKDTTLVYAPLNDTDGAVIIPDGIQIIGKQAFASHTNIDSLTISGQVIMIEEEAFKSCTGLLSVTFLGTEHDNLINFGKSAFYGCSKLTELTLPANTGKIAEHAFGGCTTLKTVRLDCGEHMEIVEKAFATTATTPVYYVTDLTLGSNVPEIDITGSFGNKLVNVVAVDNKNYESVDGVLFNKAKTRIAYFPKEREGEYEIPGTVTEIDAYTFADRENLTKVIIPASVTYIGERAFYSMSALKEAVFLEFDPEEENKTELVIGKQAFQSNGMLQQVVLPAHTVEIGDLAFASCSKMVSAFVPASVRKIGQYDETSGELVMPSSFNLSAALQAINVDENNPYYGSLNGVLYAKEEGKLTTLLYCPRECAGIDGVLDIPKTVHTIWAEAFYYNELIEKITFSEGIEGDLAIGAEAFYYTDMLTAIELPRGLKEIGDMVFYLCDLVSVTIPNTVERIGYRAFGSCSKLTTVTFEPGNNETPLDLADGSVTSDQYGNYYYGVFSGCSKLTSIELPERTRTLGGAAFAGCVALEEVYLPSSIKEIGDHAFREVKTLKTVTFGEGAQLERIGKNAFYSCQAMTDFVLPVARVIDQYAFYQTRFDKVILAEGVEEIGYYTFAYNTNLKEVYLPASLKLIDHYRYVSTTGSVTEYDYSYTFNGCTALEKVVFAEGCQLKVIPERTFNSCTALSYINLPASIEEVQGFAFNGCAGITEIHFSKNLKFIGDSAFVGCKSLKTVTFEEGINLENIGKLAFSNTALTSFTFPENADFANVKLTVGAQVFSGCTELTAVHVSGSVISLNAVLSGASALKTVTIAETSENYKMAPDGAPLILNKAGNAIVLIFGETEDGVFEVPDGYELIADRAFENQATLTKLILPKTIKEIGQYAFTKCGNLKEVVFKDIENSALTVLGAYAFQDCVALETVSLPASLKSILNYTFEGCASLQSVNLPANLETIGQYAFDHCGSLKEITIPATVTSLGMYCFRYCGLETVTLLGNVTTFANQTFSYNNSLKTVNLPDTLTTIGGYMFAYSTSLETINIPASVETIATSAFRDCTALKSVNFIGKSNLNKIDTYAFEGTLALEAITLPEGLTEIGNYAFNESVFKEFIMPDTVTKVGTYLLAANPNLEKVHLSTKLTALGNYTFKGCTALKNVELHEGLTYLGTYTFQNSGIEEIVIPSTVTQFSTSATSNATLSASVYLFDGCKELRKVTLPETFTRMGAYIFRGTTALEEVVGLENAQMVGNYAFQNSGIMKADISGTGAANYGTYLFDGCSRLAEVTLSSTANKLTIYMFRGCSSLKEVVLPATMKTMATSAFEGSGIENIVFPATVTTLSTNMFKDCHSLQSVEFQGKVTSISANLFQNCYALKEFTIPATVTTIGSNAFLNAGLETINIPAKVTSIGSAAFSGAKLTAFTVDAGNSKYTAVDGVLCSKDQKTLQIWPSKKGGKAEIPAGVAIAGYAFNGCTELTEIVVPEGTTALPSYAFFGLGCDAKIVLPSTLTNIGTYAFKSANITSVEIPDSVTVIGQYAFQDSAIETITIPEGVTHLCTIPTGTSKVSASTASYMFSGCENLKEVNLPSTLKYIGTYTFQNCTSLEHIEIPASVEIIGNYAFKNTGIKEFELKAGVTYGTYLFQQSLGLESLVVADGVTELTNYSFDGAENLKSVKLPNTLTTIGTYVFRQTGFTTIDLPASVTTVGNYAFYGSALTEITIPKTVTSWGTYMFVGSENLAKVVIEEGVTALPNYMFQKCPALKEVIFPERSLTTVGTYLFSESGLEEIEIPGSLTALGNYAFKACEQLRKVKLNVGLEVISMYSFQNCYALEEINVPATVTEIGTLTFQNCTSLKSIYIPASCIIGVRPFENWTEEQTIYAELSLSEAAAVWNAQWRDNSNANFVFEYTPA